jgi:hypothetical protein
VPKQLELNLTTDVFADQLGRIPQFPSPYASQKNKIRDWLKSLDESQIKLLAESFGLQIQNALFSEASIDLNSIVKALVNKFVHELEFRPENISALLERLDHSVKFPYAIVAAANPSKISELLEPSENELPEHIKTFFTSVGIAKHQLVSNLIFSLMAHKLKYSGVASLHTNIGTVSRNQILRTKLKSASTIEATSHISLTKPSDPLSYIFSKYQFLKAVNSPEKLAVLNMFVESMYGKLILLLNDLDILRNPNSFVGSLNKPQINILLQELIEDIIAHSIKELLNQMKSNPDIEDFIDSYLGRFNSYFVDDIRKTLASKYNFAEDLVYKGILTIEGEQIQIDINTLQLENQIQFNLAIPNSFIPNDYIASILQYEPYLRDAAAILMINLRPDLTVKGKDGIIYVIDFKNNFMPRNIQSLSRDIEDLLYVIAAKLWYSDIKRYLNKADYTVFGIPVHLVFEDEHQPIECDLDYRGHHGIRLAPGDLTQVQMLLERFVPEKPEDLFDDPAINQRQYPHRKLSEIMRALAIYFAEKKLSR